MPVASLNSLSFAGLAQTFKLLPSKHTGASNLPVHFGGKHIVS
jgi:hypothetical protein